MTNEEKNGVRYALAAYGAWGLFPLYWKLLQTSPSVVILFHRVLWSWVFYSFYRAYRERRWSFGFPANKRLLLQISGSALLISVNWLTYIWAVNGGHIVESSLGYFINPLMNVLFGTFLLRERLSRDQTVAVVMAAIGVVILSVEAGRPPWIALALALTFSAYGLARKKIEVGSFAGGQAESLLMVVPVLLLTISQGVNPLSASARDWIFFVGAGVVTGLPLIWFVEAGKRLPYSFLGFFQYIAPTLQFLTGVLVFRETVTPLKMAGFATIWLGLAWMLGRSAWTYSRARVAQPSR